MRTLLVILLTLAVAAPATWYLTRRSYSRGESSSGVLSPPTGRKLLYYQSAMHPWIKSDKPGRCTICGMELTPVYEGDTGFDGIGEDVVPLTQSMIQVMHVQTAEAQVLPLRKTLTVAGMIDDNATRHRVLSAYISGRIQKLSINYLGAEVGEGEPLAEFYSPALLQAEREYRTLSGELRSATALRLLQMGLTSAQIEALPQKPGDMLTSQILAPIGGTVVEQSVFEGQYVQEGEKLFEIADFSTMWFQFRAYEQDLPWITLGLKVDVTTLAHPGKTFAGDITFIDPNFEEATRSTKVRVELDNPVVEGRRLLLHRLYADGRVHLEAPEVLTAPRSAVIETGPEAVAYVDEGDGVYSRRLLKLGRRGDALVEIAGGLNSGDKVVVNGNLLIDGQAEMNRAFAAPAGPSPDADDVPGVFPALTEAQGASVRAFLTLADDLAAALAYDDLEGYNGHAERSHTATPALLEAFGDDSPWRDLLMPLALAGHLMTADDLQSARADFHPFSNAVVELAHALRRTGKEFDTLKIFRCPMTKDAFAGAPHRAEWMQLKGPVRNPYFGAEMLDCGSEVKS